jgi:hypothetical protein
MKGTDIMAQSLENPVQNRSNISKFADFILLLLACGGLGYLVGKQMAGGQFAIQDGLILITGFGLLFVIARRRMQDFPALDRSNAAMRYILQIGIGMVIGAGGISLLIFVAGDAIKLLVDQQRYWQLAAIALSAMYVIVSAIIALLSANKKMLNVKPGDEPLSDDEFSNARPMLVWAALGLLIYGAILGILAMAVGTEGAPNWYALAALMVALAGQWIVNFILWKRYDELYREVTRTACAISYVLIEAMILLWAGLSIFGFQVSFDPMAAVVLLMSISLVTTITVSVRRGIN